MKVSKPTLLFLLKELFLNGCYFLGNISSNDVNHALIIFSKSIAITYPVFIVSGYPLLFKRR